MLTNGSLRWGSPAQIDENNICIGVSQLNEEDGRENLIKMDSYDSSILGKKYDNGQWIDNPDYVEPEPEVLPTISDLNTSIEELKSKNETLEQQNTALMLGMVDVYSALQTLLDS